MKKILDQFITAANLVALVSLSNLVYTQHLQLGAKAEFFFFFLFSCVLLNVYTLMKGPLALRAILITAEIFFCFLISQYLYLGHSYHFWFWSVFIWTTLGLLKKKISFEAQLSCVQFFILSIYTCAGLGKVLGIVSSREAVFLGIGLISSLFTDVYLKFPPFIIELLVEHVVLTNLLIALVILLQLSGVVLFFISPRKVVGLPFILFHMINIFILGTSFLEAVMTLIVFFLVPYFDFTQEELENRGPS